MAEGKEPAATPSADLEWGAGGDELTRVSARVRDFAAHWANSMRLPEQGVTFHGDAGVTRATAPFNADRFGAARVEWPAR